MKIGLYPLPTADCPLPTVFTIKDFDGALEKKWQAVGRDKQNVKASGAVSARNHDGLDVRRLAGPGDEGHAVRSRM